MSSTEDVVASSPVDFQTAVAYALQPEMRRLVIVYLVGGLMFSFGTAGFLGSDPFYSIPSLVEMVVSLVVAIAGAALLFGGLIGALFKIVVDANRLAATE